MVEKNLKFYRLRSRLTKKELALRVGVSPMAITHYENGDRKPDIDMLHKLAEALGVRIADFLARWCAKALRSILTVFSKWLMFLAGRCSQRIRKLAV